MQHNSPLLSPKRYFVIIALMTCLWLVMFVNSQPRWIQGAAETLNIRPVLKAQPDSFYNEHIDPIFEKYCVACHKDGKQKGHLRLDSFRQLHFSGKSEADLTQADNNLLLARMSLPAEDRLAMPPYGRERHSESDLKIIKMWLDKGASGQLKEEAFPDAPAKAKVIKFKQIDWQKIEKDRAPLASAVKTLQGKFNHSLHYQARTSAKLVLVSFSIKDVLTDSVLKEFSAVSKQLVEVDLSNSLITDKSLPWLATFPQLTKLNLANTQVSNKAIFTLLDSKQLTKVIVDQALLNAETKARFEQASIELVGVTLGVDSEN